MNINMKLSFSIFLMLMLTQAALSVPANKKGDEVERRNVPAEIVNTLKSFLDQLSHLKVVEDSKRIAEKVTDLIKQDLADIKKNADEVLKSLTSPEMEAKWNDVLNEMKNRKLVNDTRIVVQRLTTSLEKELVAILQKVENLIDSPEKLKNIDLKRELSNLKLKESVKNITQEVQNIVKNEYADLRTKLEVLLNAIYSAENMQKLEAIMEKINNLKVVEAARNVLEKVDNETRKAFPGITAKIDNIKQQIESAELEKKLEDLIVELSNLNVKEIAEKASKGAKDTLQLAVQNVKTKLDEIVKALNPTEIERKLEDLRNEVAKTKIVESLVNLVEGLSKLVKQELKPNKKNKNEKNKNE